MCVDIVGQMQKSNAAEGTEVLWELVSTLARLAQGGGWHAEGQACECEVRDDSGHKGNLTGLC